MGDASWLYKTSKSRLQKLGEARELASLVAEQDDIPAAEGRGTYRAGACGMRGAPALLECAHLRVGKGRQLSLGLVGKPVVARSAGVALLKQQFFSRCAGKHFGALGRTLGRGHLAEPPVAAMERRSATSTESHTRTSSRHA